MTFFRNGKTNSVLDVIRCDESSYLVWRWTSGNAKALRENAIRWGSALRIKDGEAAVFIHNHKNEVHQDYIVGPFDGILKTQNLPILSNIVGLIYGGDTPFQAEVYFINLAKIVQVRFGVPFFDVYDPRFPDFGVPVAVRGTISFSIGDVGTFIQLHRLQNFSIDDFQKQIRDVVCRYIKDVVANTPAAHNIPVVQLETKTAQINDAVEYDLKHRLEEDFGVFVSGIDIGAIEIDKSSDSYAQLMSITKGMTAQVVQAQTEVNVKQIKDKQRIEAENYQETLRLQREEAQYAQHKQTQTAHFAVYQTEAQTEVGIAGAEALGKMGSGNDGRVSVGGACFNPAAMMAGMTIGGAIGQNLAGTMNGIMNKGQSIPASVPPPIPTAAYHVAVNGQVTGPYDFTVLSNMAITGQLTAESFVWKNGMTQWEKAGDVEDLKHLFPSTPPIPPIS